MKKASSASFIPESSGDRKKPRGIKGHQLKKDSGGFFILKPSQNSPTAIREDIPYSVGYALELTRDDALTPDQVINQD